VAKRRISDGNTLVEKAFENVRFVSYLIFLDKFKTSLLSDKRLNTLKKYVGIFYANSGPFFKNKTQFSFA